jgi:hypothetical protein
MDTWRKSSYSTNGGATCIEVAEASSGVAVRDTTDRAGNVLVVSADAWQEFTATLR